MSFIKITDRGGYIGSIFWENGEPSLPKREHHASPFGVCCFLGNRNITGQSWAGALWIVRAFTH